MSSILLRLLPALLLIPFSAQGTVVTTATDEDDGSLGGGTGISLREAVKYSSGTITFAPALSGQTIRLTLGEILISQSLTIDGSALPEKITLSGDKTGDGKTTDDTRVFKIGNNTTVVLNSLIISRGSSTQGGGIFVSSNTAALTVQKSAFLANSATDGAAIYFLGQLNTPESFLRIENSTFTGNTATGEAGAIRIFGRLLVDDSTFAGNIARSGGAIHSRDGTVQISKSTFTGNTATADGGAIWNYRSLTVTNSTFSGSTGSYGGAIHCAFNGDLTMENSTLTANAARNFGGGIFISGAVTTLRHCTLAGNTAREGGGGAWRKISGSAPFGTLSMNSSIVTLNTAPDTPNINTGGTFTGTKNRTTGDPRLAPLGDYGGPTPSMPPLPGSPAIDTGSDDKTNPILPTDQRGFPRVSTPDGGAAEYQGNSDINRFWPLDFDGDASPFGTEQALGTDPLVSDPGNTRNITAPVINTSGHPFLSFGIGAAVPGTRWILRRSTDLLTYTEIYRYNGTTHTAAPGVTFVRTATSVTVTDSNPPPGDVFYRFEAVLAL